MEDRVVKRVRVVTKVPPPPNPVTLKRVAAYARVSTDSDEQMGSVQAQNQEDYLSHYYTLAQRHEKLQSRYEVLQKKRERSLYQTDTLSAFLFALSELDILNIKWNPTLWHTTVDFVTVNANGSLVFHFKNGSEVEVDS